MTMVSDADQFAEAEYRRRRYIEYEWDRMDWEAAMNASREEGREEGHEEMIRNALLDLPVSQVAKLLRVPEGLVSRVASQLRSRQEPSPL